MIAEKELTDLGRLARIHQDGGLGLPGHVDKSRFDDHAMRVDGAFRGPPSRWPAAAILPERMAMSPAYQGDGAVDHAAVADNEVLRVGRGGEKEDG